MIASLPMYLRAETAKAHDRYWQAIAGNLRQAGVKAPLKLSAGGEGLAQWHDPDLLISQTCGRPYRLHLHQKVTLIGTPDYGLTDCQAGYYRSAFVVRQDDARSTLADFATALFAYNETLSQSGWAAPQNHVAALGFQFTNIRSSGGHLASAEMVASGRAVIAALDAVTWSNILKYDNFSQQLRVLDWTAPTPGLPYISALNADQPKLFTAIATAISNLSKPDRETLGLKSLIAIPASAYLAVPNP